MSPERQCQVPLVPCPPAGGGTGLPRQLGVAIRWIATATLNTGYLALLVVTMLLPSTATCAWRLGLRWPLLAAACANVVAVALLREPLETAALAVGFAVPLAVGCIAVRAGSPAACGPQLLLCLTSPAGVSYGLWWLAVLWRRRLRAVVR